MPVFDEKQTQTIAWAGWRLRAPRDWRPLRIQGTWERGDIMIGDMVEAALQLRWWRPAAGRKPFDADAWLQRRLRGFGKAASEAETIKHDASISRAQWIPAPSPGSGPVWYGYAPAAGLVLEGLVNAAVAETARETVRDLVIRSLAASGTEDPTLWAVFGSSVTVPPGYRLEDKRLNIGDLAFRFRNPRGERILTRQVYPVDLALSRRSLPKWLELSPFQEHRRFRKAAAARPWETTVRETTVEGLREDGVKRLPWPLGWCAPRQSARAILHDKQLNRLLVAEVDTIGTPDDILRTTLKRMNEHHAIDCPPEARAHAEA